MLTSRCHWGNKKTHNNKAHPEQLPWPQVQLPDGVPQPQDLKACTRDEGKSDSPTSCQVEEVSPGGDWQFGRTEETEQR